MISNPDQTANLESKLNLLGLALCFGAPVLGAILIWLVLVPSGDVSQTKQDIEVFKYALTAIAVAEIPIAIVIKKAAMSGKMRQRRGMRSGPQTPRAAVTSAHLVAYAMVASPVAYAIVLYMISGDPNWATALLLIPPVGYWLTRPNADEIDAAIKRMESLQA